MLKREPLPESVEREMTEFRRAMRNSVPYSYVRFHERLALETLEAMKEAGLKVFMGELVDDGWADGMQALQAVVELPNGELAKIQWNDTNQGFLQFLPNGGRAYPHSDELKPFFNRERG